MSEEKLSFKSAREAKQRIGELNEKQADLKTELEEKKNRLSAQIASNTPTGETEKQISRLSTLIDGLDGAMRLVSAEHGRLVKQESIKDAEHFADGFLKSFESDILPQIREALRTRAAWLQEAALLAIRAPASQPYANDLTRDVKPATIAEMTKGIERMITKKPKPVPEPKNMSREDDPGQVPAPKFGEKAEVKERHPGDRKLTTTVFTAADVIGM